MLKATTNDQRDKVLKILGRESGNETASVYALCIESDDRLYIDGEITFDQMAEIADLLRSERKEMHKKARRAAIKSDIDKLWVAEHTIFAKGADAEKVEAFILSLAEYGYDTGELLKEYKQTEKITI